MATAFRLNHISLLVRSLERSVPFYQDVLQLPEIECLARRPNIRWFGLGTGQSIHLIEGDFGETLVKMSTHLCISSTDFEATVRRLESLEIRFGDLGQNQGKTHLRADGVRSVYLQDPDGYWIEINEDY